MGGYCVSPAGLRAAATKVSGVKDALDGMDVKGACSTAGQGLQDTQTARALEQAALHLEAALGVLAKDLESYAKALTKSSEDYTFTDQSSAARLLKAANAGA